MVAMDTRAVVGRAVPLGEGLSRRRALQGIAAGGLAAALAARAAGRAAAQDGDTPVAGEDAPEVVEAWLDAWNTDDPAAELAALYTEDGVHEDVPTGTRSEPGEVETFLAAFIEQIDDIESERRNVFGAGGWAAAEWDFAFSYTGQLEGLPPGTGERVSVRGATVFELEGEAIRRSSDYYDTTAFLAALGLLPAPGGTEAGTTPAAGTAEEDAPAEEEGTPAA